MDLTPEWIVGFVEGEGSFYIGIQPSGKWFTVSPMFSISLHEKDKAVLEGIKSFFGFGTIGFTSKDSDWYKTAGINASNTCKYSVGGFEKAKILRDFFAKQHMYSAKKKDFNIWSEVIDLMLAGKHQTREGFLEICRLREDMNTGSPRQASFKGYDYWKSLVDPTPTP